MSMSQIINTYYRSILEVTEQFKKRGVVVYGAGFWGSLAVEILKLFSIVPLCFCDDDEKKQDVDFCGYRVYSLDDAFELYPTACFFAAADNFGMNSDRRKMNEKLEKRGLLSEVSGFHPLRYAFLLELKDGWKEINVKKRLKVKSDQVESILIINHTQNSGINYFESLMDGHGRIINIPSFGGWCNLLEAYRKRLCHLQGDELVLEIMAQLSPCICNRYLKGTHVNARFFQNFLIYNNIGEREDRLSVNAVELFHMLRHEVGRNKLSFEELLCAVYVAYNNCCNNRLEPNVGKVLLFHDHQVGKRPEEYPELLCAKRNIKYIYIIREPIQRLFSLIKYVDGNLIDQQEFVAGNWKKIIRCDTGESFSDLCDQENVRVVRFEDIKKDTKAQMQKIAKYLNIPYNDSMLETTANGITIYNKVKTDGGEVRIEAGNGLTSINRSDYGVFFSKEDIEVLRKIDTIFLKKYYPESSYFDTDVLKFEELHFSFENIIKKWFYNGNDLYGEEEWESFVGEVREYIFISYQNGRKEAGFYKMLE